MEKKYKTVALEKAYKLINTGFLSIVCSRSLSGCYNLAPIAWHTAIEYNPYTRLMIVVDKNHCTTKNILQTKEFGMALPHISQVDLVKKIGNCSGKLYNKYEKFKILSQRAKNIDVLFPINCIGYLECSLYNHIEDGEVMLFFGKVLNAYAHKEAYQNRLLAENEPGKGIYHLGSKYFISTSNIIH